MTTLPSTHGFKKPFKPPSFKPPSLATPKAHKHPPASHLSANAATASYHTSHLLPTSNLLPTSATLMTCDSLCAEYLLFRGYTDTVLSLHTEKGEPPSNPDAAAATAATAAAGSSAVNMDSAEYFKSVLFSPEKLVTAIFTNLTTPTPTSYSSFLSLWSLLSTRFFANLVAGGLQTSFLTDMSNDLKKLYLVNCIATDQRHLVTAFFELANNPTPTGGAPPPPTPPPPAAPHVFKRSSKPPEETRRPSNPSNWLHPPATSLPPAPNTPSPLDETWRSWYALPFLAEPRNDPLFELYFTPEWERNLQTSLFNLLSSIVHAVPIPRFVFLERWAHTTEQQRQRMVMTNGSYDLARATARVDELSGEVRKLKEVCEGLVGLIATDVRESKRVVGGGKVNKLELFREEGEAQGMREGLLKDVEGLEVGREDFVGSVERFLAKLREINGISGI